MAGGSQFGVDQRLIDRLRREPDPIISVDCHRRVQDTTVAWNDESGRRGFALAIPTVPDDAIDTAQATALDTAACRMLRGK